MNPLQKLLWVLVLLAAVATAGAGARVLAGGGLELPVLGEIGAWSLTAEDGRPIGDRDLQGKIWIVDFIFTNCAGPCPLMTDGMKALVDALPDDPRFHFVSFSVDAQNDTPEVLRNFAKRWNAPPRWRFVTGVGVYNLAIHQFKLGVEPDPYQTPGSEWIHSTRFTLVDGAGRMRGTYVYDYENGESIGPTLDAIARDARRLAREPDRLMSVRNLPRLNAGLNGVSFLFLATGLAFILKKRVGLHKASMTAALVASILFLASYVTYHVQVGSVKYDGVGWMRTAYFAILISHTVLAAVVAPMAIVTVVRAWRGRFDRHVAIARWTLPVWMYVSLTGILVYLLLYGPA